MKPSRCHLFDRSWTVVWYVLDGICNVLKKRPTCDFVLTLWHYPQDRGIHIRVAPYAYEATKRELIDCNIHAVLCDSSQKEVHRYFILCLIEPRDCSSQNPRGSEDNAQIIRYCLNGGLKELAQHPFISCWSRPFDPTPGLTGSPNDRVLKLKSSKWFKSTMTTTGLLN